MVGDQRPPVTEVVLSVSFDPQSSLSGPQLFLTLRDLLAKYSRIEEQPPYEMPLELPTELQLSQRAEPPFKIIGGTGPLERRYWLFDPMDDSTVVQIQSNYFAVNWRKTKNSNNYVGFDRLIKRFQEILSEVQEAVKSAGGARLSTRQAELSYINIVRPDDFWSDHSEVEKVLQIDSPALSRFEQLNFAYTRPLANENSDFVGRLQSFVQTGYVANDDDTSLEQAISSGLMPIINVTTHVRSARLAHPSHDLMVGFLHKAHEEAGTAFRTITTDEARANWGI